MPDLFLHQSVKCFLRDPMGGETHFDTYNLGVGKSVALIQSSPYCTTTQRNVGHLESAGISFFLMFFLVAWAASADPEEQRVGNFFFALFLSAVAALIVPMLFALVFNLFAKIAILVSVVFLLYGVFKLPNYLHHHPKNSFSLILDKLNINKALEVRKVKKERELQLLENKITQLQLDPVYIQAMREVDTLLET